MAKSMTVEEKVLYTAAYTDEIGKPDVPATPPVWSLSDPTLATLAPGTDGFSTWVLGVGIGDVIVTATLAEVVPIVITDTLTITAPNATAGVLTAGQPVSQ